MNKFTALIFIIFLLAFAPIKTQAQWTDISPNISTDFKHIYFADNNIGYVMSDTLLIKTINGGLNWNMVLNTDSVIFTSVFFVNADTGYVAGSNKSQSIGVGNVLFKTMDGGFNWMEIGDGGLFHSIQFLNAQIGFASRFYFSDIWTTNDGGLNWTSRTSPIASTTLANDIFFKDTISNGYVLDGYIGRFYEFNKNSNFYYDFAFCTPTPPAYYNATGVVNDTLIYAVGDSGIIYKKINTCGANWVQQTGISIKDNFGVHFLNQDTGLVVGADGQIQTTTNGGLTWVGQISNTTDTLRNVIFADENTAYAIGDNGTILKNNNTVGIDIIEKSSNPFTIFPNPSSTEIVVTFESEFFTKNDAVDIKISDIKGQKVLQINNIQQSTIHINTNNLTKGMYFISLIAKQQVIYTNKVVIQ